jgi:stage V sporulation protein AC
MSIDKSNYKDYVENKTPKSPIIRDCVFAFLVGGFICVIGQFIKNLSIYLGAGLDDTKTIVPVVLIFVAGLLTAFGIYDKIGKFAGAGSIIPITGFANSIVSSAMEFKKEGWILGLGAKIFTIAGPVIVYGTVASVVYGVIYWITTFF